MTAVSKKREYGDLVALGVLMAGTGYGFPGLWWCFTTPGDVEMITVAAAFVWGSIGVAIVLTYTAMLVFDFWKNRHEK